MNRLLALLCGWFAAIGLPGCDYLNLCELQPGVSSAAEVRERFGPPQMEWLNTDGSVTWEYSRQPEGAECYMITVGPDNILRHIDQVLNEAQFARVQPGMSGDQVRRLLGRPASSQFFELKQETVWAWLIERGSTIGDPTYFTVAFDGAGQVVGTGRYSTPKR
jgi:hypothetical protein